MRRADAQDHRAGQKTPMRAHVRITPAVAPSLGDWDITTITRSISLNLTLVDVLRLALRHYPIQKGRSRVTAWATSQFRIRGTCVVAGPEGTKIKLDLSQFPSQQWFWFGSWEPEDMAVVRDRLRPGMTAIDVGANVGIFTLAMAQLVGISGHVHAFEPDATNLALLKENLAINGLRDRIDVSHVALSDEAGFIRFESTRDAASSHVSAIGNEVPTLRLDDYPVSRLDLVKIDVEGMECKVLRGARRTLTRFRPVLLVECAQRHLTRAGSSVAELEKTLDELGYIRLDIAGRTFGDRSPFNENLLCLPKETRNPNPTPAAARGARRSLEG
jgi:FkbM family methyltransferase